MRRILSLELPIRTLSLNKTFREHPKARGRRIKAQKETVLLALRQRGAPELPVIVRMTRISSGRLDRDNLYGACKAPRDAIAAWLGADDADPRILWKYDQEQRRDVGKIRVFERSGKMREVHGLFLKIEVDQVDILEFVQT